MDELNHFFTLFDRIHDRASWKAAFGEPQTREDKTIIPVASVGYGFRVGFGRQMAPGAADEDQVAGGSAAMSTPVAIIEVTPASTIVRPVINYNRLIPAILLVLVCVVILGTGMVRKAIEAADRCQ